MEILDLMLDQLKSACCKLGPPPFHTSPHAADVRSQVTYRQNTWSCQSCRAPTTDDSQTPTPQRKHQFIPVRMSSRSRYAGFTPVWNLPISFWTPTQEAPASSNIINTMTVSLRRKFKLLFGFYHETTSPGFPQRQTARIFKNYRLKSDAACGNRHTNTPTAPQANTENLTGLITDTQETWLHGNQITVTRELDQDLNRLGRSAYSPRTSGSDPEVKE